MLCRRSRILSARSGSIMIAFSVISSVSCEGGTDHLASRPATFAGRPGSCRLRGDRFTATSGAVPGGRRARRCGGAAAGARGGAGRGGARGAAGGGGAPGGGEPGAGGGQ